MGRRKSDVIVAAVVFFVPIAAIISTGEDEYGGKFKCLLISEFLSTLLSTSTARARAIVH